MDQIYKLTNWFYKNMPPKRNVVLQVQKEISRNTGNYRGGLVRIAGISGAIAVILGAYGAHSLKQKEFISEERKLAFETGSKYHLIHSVALLATPLTNRPKLVGCLLIGGMLLFSGSCYWFALTDNRTVKKITPVGGMMFIAAWASMTL